MIRRLCIGAVALGAIVLAAPAASAEPEPSVRIKEGACIVQRDLGAAYCVSDPFPYVHALLDGLPL